jgi:glycosyltransferase involved in cell wall biosynthesis
MNLLDFFVFGWKYSGIILKTIPKENHKKVETLTYITHRNTEKWILGAKARRLARHSNLKTTVSFISDYRDIQKADAYFFLHPNIFAKTIRANPSILAKRNVVMFTHPVLKNRFSMKHRIYVLNKAEKVIFLNKQHARLMTDNGLEKTKVEIMHLGSDAELFQPHQRGNGKICMSMAYYERKNPELMFEVIKGMPNRQFLLIGPQWESYPKIEQLLEFPNLEYHATPEYSSYPELYAKCDVFFSPSHLEGGPVPLLETMLCNMVPVATKTGYCNDIIKHGKNGFLFDSTAKTEFVIPLIEKAFQLTTNTRESVIDYTWDKYSKKIDMLFL